MAKLSKQINNNLIGRLGNVVYYESNGKTCVRSLPTSYKDKKSEKQLLQRKKIIEIGNLFHLFRPAIRIQTKVKNLNLYNIFLKLNWKNVLVPDLNSVEINYEKIILYNQNPIKLLNLTITQSLEKVNFVWEDDRVLDNTYLVLCAVYCKGLQEVYVSEVIRNTLSTFVNIPPNAGPILTYTFTYRRRS